MDDWYDFDPDPEDPEFGLPNSRPILVHEGFVPVGNADTTSHANDSSHESPSNLGVACIAPTTSYRIDQTDQTISSGAWIDVTAAPPGRRAPWLYHEKVPTTKPPRRVSKPTTLQIPLDHQPIHRVLGIECSCGAPFTGVKANNNWKRHIEDVLFPNRFVCPYKDGFRCARRNGLNQHAIRRHGKKLLSCPYCNRMFTSQFDLNRHIESAHPSRRPEDESMDGRRTFTFD